MVKAKYWTINEKPVGLPKLNDFVLVEEDLPEVKDGEIIMKAEYLSVDPYMRYRLRQMNCGEPVTGIISSKNKEFPVGTYVVGYPGWRSHTLLSEKQLSGTNEMGFPYMKLPDLGNVPKSTGLGILGMPGNTAYFGLLEICEPKKGETVLVNGAAGAVGRCNVIAFAGSDEKVSWLKDVIGIKNSFNYKTADIREVIKKAAPNGINCYFDNVGGEFTATVLPLMADAARISVCGAISTYNDESKNTGTLFLNSPFHEGTIIWKQLKIEGFIVHRWTNRWMEGINQLKKWIEEGKLKYEETVTKGFENTPKAFIELFDGKNTGKAIVEV
ncbi:Prostaglandin reductase 1 [Armadillidium nasatum]|uniref:Prostaglandin reductase 1 n=1 Tax=Armadillidium nasatum TaxID=96803 RepID=A0A5N5TJM5_9CRUS|nr:Prostaglandin reductase 1 [Armadillidium nasatum]